MLCNDDSLIPLILGLSGRGYKARRSRDIQSNQLFPSLWLPSSTQVYFASRMMHISWVLLAAVAAECAKVDPYHLHSAIDHVNLQVSPTTTATAALDHGSNSTILSLAPQASLVARYVCRQTPVWSNDTFRCGVAITANVCHDKCWCDNRPGPGWEMCESYMLCGSDAVQAACSGSPGFCACYLGAA